jgi:hypothetical protein
MDESKPKDFQIEPQTNNSVILWVRGRPVRVLTDHDSLVIIPHDDFSLAVRDQQIVLSPKKQQQDGQTRYTKAESFAVGETVLLARVPQAGLRGRKGTVKKVIPTSNELLVWCDNNGDERCLARPQTLDKVSDEKIPEE